MQFTSDSGRHKSTTLRDRGPLAPYSVITRITNTLEMTNYLNDLNVKPHNQTHRSKMNRSVFFCAKLKSDASFHSMWINFYIFQLCFLTRKSPSSTRTAIKAPTLYLAATGVRRVSKAARRTPYPNTRVPPNFIAIQAPGICKAQ